MRLFLLTLFGLIILCFATRIQDNSAPSALAKSLRDLEYSMRMISESPNVQTLKSWVSYAQEYFGNRQLSLQQIQLPTSANIVVSHEWPSNIFNTGGWIGYGIFLVIIFILPILLCISLCCNMCCLYWGRCCGLCGGRKIKHGEDFKGYKPAERLCILPPYLIVFAAVTISAIVAIAFTIAFVETGRAITRATQNGVEDGFGFIATIRNGVNALFTSAGDVAGKANNAISGIGSITTLIGNVVNALASVGPVLTKMNQEFAQINSNLSDIQSINRALQTQQGLSNVPLLTEIPNLSATQNALNSAQTSVNAISSTSSQLQSQTGTAISSANSAMSGVSTQIVSVLQNARDTANTAFDTAEKQINSTVPKSTRDEVFYYVELVETLWTVLFAVIYAIPSLLLVWGILYILIGKFPLNWCFKFGACYLFIFFGLYILMFNVQFLASIILGHTCSRVPGVVSTLDARAREFGIAMPLSTPLGNISASGAISGLANCNGKTTLFDAVGVSLDSFNITNRFDDILRQFNTTLEQFNVGNTIGTANSQVNSFNLDVFNIITDYSANITSYKSKILDVQGQLSDLSRFGFNQTQLDEHFFQLNNESANLTPAGAVWGENNITALDPATAPYNQKQQYFTDKKAIITTYLSAKSNATATANEINANITRIYDDLTNIQRNLNNTLALKNQITSIPNQIGAEVAKVNDVVNDVKKNCSSLIGDVRGLFNQALDTLYTLTSCKKIGDFYRDQLQTNLCGACYTFTIIACIGSLCLGLSMCAMYPVCLSASKRVGNPYQSLARDEWKKTPPIDKIQPVYGGPPQTHDMVPIPSHEPPKTPSENPNLPDHHQPDQFPGPQNHPPPVFEPIPEFEPIGPPQNNLDAPPVVIHETPSAHDEVTPPVVLDPHVPPPVLTQHDVPPQMELATDDYHPPPPPPVDSPRDTRVGEIIE